MRIPARESDKSDGQHVQLGQIVEDVLSNLHTAPELVLVANFGAVDQQSLSSSAYLLPLSQPFCDCEWKVSP